LRGRLWVCGEEMITKDVYNVEMRILKIWRFFGIFCLGRHVIDSATFRIKLMYYDAKSLQTNSKYDEPIRLALPIQEHQRILNPIESWVWE